MRHLKTGSTFSSGSGTARMTAEMASSTAGGRTGHRAPEGGWGRGERQLENAKTGGEKQGEEKAHTSAEQTKEGKDRHRGWELGCHVSALCIGVAGDIGDPETTCRSRTGGEVTLCCSQFLPQETVQRARTTILRGRHVRSSPTTSPAKMNSANIFALSPGPSVPSVPSPLQGAPPKST